METPFTLGQIQVDPQHRTLTHNDSQQSCEPKVFDLLLYFCDRENQIITREMLFEDIWQGRVVSDNAVNRKIYQLRKLLADMDGSVEYIETIPKFGYRLTQAVVPVCDEQSENRNKWPPNINRRPYWILAVIVISMLVTFLWYQSLEYHPRVIFHKQLTSLPGVERYGSLSPNGRFLLFSHSKDHQTTTLMLKDLRNDKQYPLTQGSFHDLRGVWHPNGKQLAFVRINEQDKSCAIYRIVLDDKDGAPEEKLIACSYAGLPVLSYGEKSNHLFYADRSAKNKPFIIHLLDTDNLVKKQLTQPSLQNNLSGDYFITRNKDGDKQAVLRYLGSNKVLVSTYQSSPFELIDQFELNAHINDIAWSIDEDWFFYRHQKHIRKVDASGEKDREVHHVGRVFDGLQFANNGEDLLLGTLETDTDIWQHSLNGSQSFIGSTKLDVRPRFANTSEAVAFISDRSEDTQFWLRNPNGEVKQLSNFDFSLGNTWFNWSADDAHILFEHQDAIYSLEVATGKSQQLLNADEKSYLASYSIDGKHLYYSSTKSGNWQIWRLTLADNSHQQLTVNGGYSVYENPADNRLYFSKYHQDGLWRLNKDGSESLVIEDFSLLNWLNWKIQDNQIIYAAPYQSIFSFDLTDKTKKHLMDFESAALHDFSVSGMSGEILYTRRMSQNGDILMLHFY